MAFVLYYLHFVHYLFAKMSFKDRRRIRHTEDFLGKAEQKNLPEDRKETMLIIFLFNILKYHDKYIL